MLTAVSDTMFKYGKPKVIYISRDESADILGDLSRQLNIKLKQVAVPLKVTKYLYHHRAV